MRRHLLNHLPKSTPLKIAAPIACSFSRKRPLRQTGADGGSHGPGPPLCHKVARRQSCIALRISGGENAMQPRRIPPLAEQR
jgi:hypothetical protein